MYTVQLFETATLNNNNNIIIIINNGNISSLV